MRGHLRPGAGPGAGGERAARGGGARRGAAERGGAAAPSSSRVARAAQASPQAGGPRPLCVQGARGQTPAVLFLPFASGKVRPWAKAGNLAAKTSLDGREKGFDFSPVNTCLLSPCPHTGCGTLPLSCSSQNPKGHPWLLHSLHFVSHLSARLTAPPATRISDPSLLLSPPPNCPPKSIRCGSPVSNLSTAPCSLRIRSDPCGSHSRNTSHLFVHQVHPARLAWVPLHPCPHGQLIFLQLLCGRLREGGPCRPIRMVFSTPRRPQHRAGS